MGQNKLKKPPKNSFSFFLDDYVEKQRKLGRNISKRVAAQECAPLWRKVPEEEKKYYTQLAKADKEKEKVNPGNKFTTLGISYIEKQKEELQEAIELQNQDNEIIETVDNLTESTVRTHLFYIGHVNYFCYHAERDCYIPAELALSEFNLEDGVKHTYHVLIDPSEIPSGYGFEAKKISEEIHGLPQPPYDQGEKDYFRILKAVQKFLEPGKMSDGRFPPIYTLENNINPCKSVLKVLTESQFDEDVVLFRVYPVHKMFFRLKNRCVGLKDMGFPLMSNAIAEIDKDVFCFTHGISCEFHENDSEKYQNCSLSIVKRFVYTICDHCCQYVDVELIPGKHTRLFADTSRQSVVGSCAGSNLSSRTSEVGSEFGASGSTYASSFKSTSTSYREDRDRRKGDRDRRREKKERRRKEKDRRREERDKRREDRDRYRHEEERDRYRHEEDRDRSPRSVVSRPESDKSMKPSELPKSKWISSFHPVPSWNISDEESVTGESYISKSTIVKIEPEEMDFEVEIPRPSVGRGSSLRRPQPAVGVASLAKGTKLSAGRGKLIADDSD